MRGFQTLRWESAPYMVLKAFFMKFMLLTTSIVIEPMEIQRLNYHAVASIEATEAAPVNCLGS